jgi:hypothetical protein
METPGQRSRRRWLTLAELVAVAGVLIAALSLYLTWSDKRESADEKATEAHKHAVVQFEGTPIDKGATLQLTDPAHKVQSIGVTFPAALAAGTHQALVAPRIEADWIKQPLLDLTRKGPDAQEGRVPVLITADWWDGDTHRRDRAIYDLAWKKGGELIRGHTLRLEGVALSERGGSQARIDRLWAQEKPAS